MMPGREGNDFEKRDNRPSLSLPLLLLISLAVMIPWPLIGIGLTHGNFDQPDESILLFGGATGLVMVPISLLAEPSESVFTVILIALWLIAFLAPPIVLRLKRCSWIVVIILLILQSGFSFAQASMGMLVIWGKNC